MRLLADQLGGKVEVKPKEPGVVYIVAFPSAPDRQKTPLRHKKGPVEGN